jgi:hypothetical protein
MNLEEGRVHIMQCSLLALYLSDGGACHTLCLSAESFVESNESRRLGKDK